MLLVTIEFTNGKAFNDLGSKITCGIMVKIKIENETKHDKFKRLAANRTKRILHSLKLLGNCSNRSIYAYTEEDLSAIFNAIEKEAKRVKSLFKKSALEEFRL